MLRSWRRIAEAGRRGRTVRLVMAATGIVVVVAAVLLFSLTKTSNDETTMGSG
jgi:hypothetical protein